MAFNYNMTIHRIRRTLYSNDCHNHMSVNTVTWAKRNLYARTDTSGVTYTRWGRLQCEDNGAMLLYRGTYVSLWCASCCVKVESVILIVSVIWRKPVLILMPSVLALTASVNSVNSVNRVVSVLKMSTVHTHHQIVHKAYFSGFHCWDKVIPSPPYSL